MENGDSIGRRLSQLVHEGDAEGLRAALRRLRERVGPEAVAAELATCEFGEHRGSKSAVHSAAMRGRSAVLRELLEAKANPDATDDAGSAPLHLAAEGGHASAVRELLQFGATKDLRNNFGRTPLEKAEAGSWDLAEVAEGKSLIRELLQGRPVAPQDVVAAEASMNALRDPTRVAMLAAARRASEPSPPPDDWSDAASAGGEARRLHGSGLWIHAARPGEQVNFTGSRYAPSEVSTIDTVWEAEPPPGAPLLTELVRRGELGAVRARLAELTAGGGMAEAVAEVSNIEEGAQDTRIVMSPLHVAAIKGNVEILRALLATRADVNLANDTGNTLLHVAAGMGNEEVVCVLLAMGADPQLRNNFGRSAAAHARPEAWESEEVRRRKAAVRAALEAVGAGEPHERAEEVRGSL